MGKVKNDTNTTTQKAEPKEQAVSKVPTFQNAMIEMSWRVALPFMLLSLGGIQLDKKFETDPAFSLVGLFLAVVAVSIIVVRYVNTNFPGTFGGKQ